MGDMDGTSFVPDNLKRSSPAETAARLREAAAKKTDAINAGDDGEGYAWALVLDDLTGDTDDLLALCEAAEHVVQAATELWDGMDPYYREDTLVIALKAALARWRDTPQETR